MGATDPRLLLNVPGEINAMMEEDLSLAIRWREATRLPFLHYLGRGYEVREFVRSGAVSGYVLECRETEEIDLCTAGEGAEGKGDPGR